MKREDITYTEKINELRQLISHPNNKTKVFVFVEGESDLKFYKKIFHAENCQLTDIPGAKGKVETALRLFTEKNYKNVLGVCDADFSHCNNISPSHAHLFLTDYHDAEIFMISSNQAFSAVLTEYSDIEERRYLDLRQEVFQALIFLSYLRLLNENEKLELKFDHLDFRSLYHAQSFVYNEDDILKEVIAQSPNGKEKNIEVLKKGIERLSENSQDCLFLCNGHDCMKLLAWKISNHKKAISNKDLERNFRVAYHFSEFQKTKLYNNLTQWSIGIQKDIF